MAIFSCYVDLQLVHTVSVEDERELLLNVFKRESVRRSSSESGFISFVVSGFTSSPF